MVKSELIYFGNPADSASGMKRALPCFLLLMTVLSVVFFRNSELIKRSKKITFVTVFALSVVLCSALGVQLPKSAYEAALYGFLVGCVTGVSYFCLTYLNVGYVFTARNYITVLLLIVSMSSTALINFYIQKRL
jgi:hypothetical protein